ncbi:MAG: FAD-dependent pyridine nucleotide-disulfide oxidoreductase [Frankiales bacterium]|nr:FAD-dependent pyridine nucleotide-disulfide oxidoreductase [Frankiales bacterium]
MCVARVQLAPAPSTLHPVRDVVVVGGGLAGARAVQELRGQGYDGRLTLLAAEPHLPYDRPPLSKGRLQDDEEKIALDVPWDDLDVDLRLGCRATRLRATRLETSDGDVPYDGLVLATGAQPNRLPGSGFTLRGVDDARELGHRLVDGARVVVVGAGWVGAEVATVAAQAGCDVTVLEAGEAPLAALPREVGGYAVPWYAEAGIDLRLRAKAVEVEHDRVRLEDGETLTADVVLVAVGAAPDTDWLAGSGIALDHGVLVDEHLSTDLPGVVAAGDCVARWSPRYATRLRVEHWDDALHGPAVAAATLLGKEAVYDPVPYFWSDQLGHTLQWAGFARGADAVIRRGKPGSPDGWAFCWLAGPRLVAMLTVDRPRDLVQGRRRIDQGAQPDPARLADLAVPVKSA